MRDPEPLRRFGGRFQEKCFCLPGIASVPGLFTTFARVWGKCRPETMDELAAGDQVLLHDEATVLTRFPTPEEKEAWRGKPGKVTTFMSLAQTE